MQSNVSVVYATWNSEIFTRNGRIVFLANGLPLVFLSQQIQTSSYYNKHNIACFSSRPTRAQQDFNFWRTKKKLKNKINSWLLFVQGILYDIIKIKKIKFQGSPVVKDSPVLTLPTCKTHPFSNHSHNIVISCEPNVGLKINITNN